MALKRPATHAGSWYSANAAKLGAEIDRHLLNGATALGKPPGQAVIPKARVLVGPHAGYTYAGPQLGETYAAFDFKDIKRLFILGPSHHVYIEHAETSAFHSYETPFGNVNVDKETTAHLNASGLTQYMSATTDKDEHSFEMHMPFLKRVIGDQDIQVIPIMVGQTTQDYEKKLADLLLPYVSDPQNAFVISTDFCHWGNNFRYFGFSEDPECTSVSQDKSSLREALKTSSTPIYKSIEYLDKKGMEVASLTSYDKWKEYCKYTDNTICGRKPLAILIAVLESYAIQTGSPATSLNWIGYSQSNQVKNISEGSVSYASGYAIL